jgi:hypothetical protein
MDDTRETPLYDLLRAQLLQCDVTIASATSCLRDDWLRPYWPAYCRQLAQARMLRDRIAAKIAALPKAPVYAGGRKEELRALMRQLKAHEITPAAFSAEMRRLMETT